MGKNYTLYVKHDKFDAEDNKSGLVNELLGKHYDHYYKATPSSTIQPAATVQDLGFKDTASAARAFKQNVGPTLQRTPKPSTFDKDIQFCPHGAVKGMCKKGCK